MHVLDAVVDFAKVVGIIVAAVVLLVVFRRLPLKYRSIVKSVAAAIFLINLLGSSWEQYAECTLFLCGRISALFNAVIGLSIVFFVLHIVARFSRRTARAILRSDIFKDKGRLRVRFPMRFVSCSFLSITPVMRA